MPTATSPTPAPLPTPTKSGNGHAHPHKQQYPTPPPTLNQLYNKAARAFLHRNTALTQSLLDEAFSILESSKDKNDDVRRWCILRITFETTLYATPTPAVAPALLAQTPNELIKRLYDRCIALFTPGAGKSDAAYLPPALITTLALSSLKLDCPSAGREIVEEWLARRGLVEGVDWEGEGYEKVVETYVLRVLPRLRLWEYAEEFMGFEQEMDGARREKIKDALRVLQQADLMSKSTALNPHDTPTPQGTSPRPSSPSPSTSSSSSSLSTTSTRTAVPLTPRHPSSVSPRANPKSSRSRASSTSSSATATPRRRNLSPAATAVPSSSPSRSAPYPPASSITPLFSAGGSSTPHPGPPIPTSISTPNPTSRPNTSTALPPPRTTHILEVARKTMLRAGWHVANARWTGVVMMVLVWLVLRVRRARSAATPSRAGLLGVTGGATGLIGGGPGPGTAEMVRGRLAMMRQGAGVWGEVVRAVGDVVKMAGGGLV